MQYDNLELLEKGCKQLAINLSQQQLMQLHSYVSLLQKWNKVYNLSSIINYRDVVIKHVLDSLSIMKYIDNVNIIDIGSGAGLPGIIIAIVKPDCYVTVLDSNGKKTAFLQQVKIQLKLQNLTVLHERVELYKKELFDIVISRAFASLADFIALAGHLLAADGKIFAMKAKLVNTEINDFEQQGCNTKYQIQEVRKLLVPFMDEERYLIEINKLKK